MRNFIYVVSGLLLLSSCGMGWSNGGEDEFNGKCEQFVNREFRDIEEITPDVEKTCDCLLDEAKKQYPNYEDFLMNRMVFFEAKIDVCLIKK